jgi:hypothetical protein
MQGEKGDFFRKKYFRSPCILTVPVMIWIFFCNPQIIKTCFIMRQVDRPKLLCYLGIQLTSTPMLKDCLSRLEL